MFDLRVRADLQCRVIRNMMHISKYMTYTDYNFSMGARASQTYLKTITWWYYHYIISNRSFVFLSRLVSSMVCGVRIMDRKTKFISMCEVVSFTAVCYRHIFTLACIWIINIHCLHRMRHPKQSHYQNKSFCIATKPARGRPNLHTNRNSKN